MERLGSFGRPIPPLDEAASERARERQSKLTKPEGSLGTLEVLAVRLAGIQGRDSPRTAPRAIAVFAGDHGITEEGVSPYPSDVTGQMLSNFASGGAAINAIARVHQAGVSVINVGAKAPPTKGASASHVRAGTRNFAREPAMTHKECRAAIDVGATEARRMRANALVGLGEMGIGNTSAASAMTSALTGEAATNVTGRGTGLDDVGLARKVKVIEGALAQHAVSEPLEILRCFGGLEIAALVGFCLEAAAQRVAILVDGFITTAAVAIAWKVRPRVLDYTFFSHRSAEPGHAVLLDWMSVEPLLDLGLRLGEGTGAALAMPIFDGAVAAHNEMATFESAGISSREP